MSLKIRDILVKFREAGIKVQLNIDLAWGV